jgi:ferrous iron transport protein B
LRQRTGNWAGTTVARAEGVFAHGGARFRLVDLPGTPSLLTSGPDEAVARDFLLFGRPDATVVVADATRLEQSLVLALEVLEVTGRVVLAVNLIDEARRHGLRVDARRLARDLGVPVVLTAARRREGLPDLRAAVAAVAGAATPARRRPRSAADTALDAAVGRLVPRIEAAFPGLPNVRWVALRLLDGDERVAAAVRAGTLGDLRPAASGPAPGAGPGTGAAAAAVAAG